MKADSTVFCLAGMHRSGTSLLANWFYNSNVYIGKEFLGPASSNKKGHFEDIDFLELHIHDLEEKGRDNAGLIVDDQRFRLGKEGILKARNILSKRSNKPLWGWKEPRSTLYLLHWKELIPQLKVVAIFREPAFVIDSLYERLKRNKWYKTNNPVKKLQWWWDIDKNPKKWKTIFLNAYERYNKEILAFQELYADDIIIFELTDLLKNPDIIAAKICSILKTKNSFVDFSTVFTKEDLNMNGSKQKVASNIYETLKKQNNPFN